MADVYNIVCSVLVIS